MHVCDTAHDSSICVTPRIHDSCMCVTRPMTHPTQVEAFGLYNTADHDKHHQLFDCNFAFPFVYMVFFFIFFWFVYKTADHNKRHHLFDCNHTFLFIFMFFCFCFFVFGYISQLPCTSTCSHAHAPSPCSVSTCIGVCIFVWTLPPSLSSLVAL